MLSLKIEDIKPMKLMRGWSFKVEQMLDNDIPMTTFVFGRTRKACIKRVIELFPVQS